MAFRDHRSAAPAAEEVPAVDRPSAAVRAAIIDLERKGRLSAAQVVEAARNPASPLHACFEWADDVAAEGYRLEQARRLIRGVKVIVSESETTLAAPRYVRDSGKESAEQGYVSLDQVRGEPENAKAVLVYEFGRAAACCDRALRIADALGIEDETRDVCVKLRRLLARLV